MGAIALFSTSMSILVTIFTSDGRAGLVVLTYVANILSLLRSDGATNRFPLPACSLFSLAAFLLKITDARVSGIRRTPTRADTGSESEILVEITSQSKSWRQKKALVRNSGGYSPEDRPPSQRRAHITGNDGSY